MYQTESYHFVNEPEPDYYFEFRHGLGLGLVHENAST